MLLATYQPLEKTNYVPKYKDFIKEYLGYKPIFCFPFVSLEEAQIHSILAAPNMPEKLIIFESNEFERIDVVKWNNFLSADKMGYSASSIDEIFTNEDNRYTEYIVKEITNIKHEFVIEDMIYNTKYRAEVKNSSGLEEGYNKILKTLQNNAIEYASNARIWSDSEEGYEFAMLRIKKQAFEFYILPMIYWIKFDESTFGKMISGAFLRDFYSEVSKKITRLYNTGEKSHYKTYACFDEVYRLMKNNFTEPIQSILEKHEYKKIYPNAQCPCGSGKKYKKCCGRNSKDVANNQ